VEAPTLLIVGGEDHGVIGLNEQADQALRAPKRLSIIPGATHLFEEPGALEEVARQATEWFTQYLAASD
jgi:putative phosphoribosyl transferase